MVTAVPPERKTAGQVAEYLAAIADRYPDLEVQTAHLIESGQFSQILVVNGEWIFRFPRFAAGVAQLRVEAALLEAVGPHLPLAVPNPRFLYLDSEVPGEAFMGYRLITGEPLLQKTFLSFGKSDRLRLAQALAGFLRALHTFPVTEAIAGSVPRRDGPEEWAELYARFRASLFPHMSLQARQQVSRSFEAFLGRTEHFSYRPALRHGDFGTVNLLIDRSTKAMTGVIDFGNAGVGDPALDLAALMAPVGYGEGFVRQLAPHYPLEEPALERARFYVSTFALDEALYGVEHGDTQAFEAGLAGFRQP